MSIQLSALCASLLLAFAPAAAHAQSLQPAEAARAAQSLLQPGQAAAVQAKASVFDEFVPRHEAFALQPDEVGEMHIRYDRTYQGLPVMGGDIIVHFERDGRFSHVTTTMQEPINLPGVVPAFDKAQAISKAEATFRQIGQRARQHSVSAELLVVAMPGFVTKPVLTWNVKVKGLRCDQPSSMHYLFDALTGKLYKSYEAQESAAVRECDDEKAAAPKDPFAPDVTLEQAIAPVAPLAAANGTGKSLYVGTVTIGTDKKSETQYELRDTARGSHYTGDFALGSGNTPMLDADNVWGDGTTASRQSAAADAHYGQRQTWDYYKTIHGRNGIANDGAGYSSAVHFTSGGVAQDNSFWSNTLGKMLYGDGVTRFKQFVCLDVAGHEMTHGVVWKTANFPVSGNEAAALNESTADIMGTMVEYYTNNANDTPDYMLFEKVMKNGKAAERYLYQPSLDGGSRDCWSAGVGSLDQHYSSGVGNHFYYLLAEGSKPSGGLPVSKVCKDTDTAASSDTIEFHGVTRAKAEKIWYHALANNMNSGTDYKGARVATLSSAKSLYGDDSAEYRAVDYAWLAVSVSDIKKKSFSPTNQSWQTALIVDPLPELVIMGRRGTLGKAHWFAIYLDAGKSVEANLTAGDKNSDFDLIGYDSTGKTVLVSSKNGGGAKEKITLQNTGAAKKLFFISVPVNSSTAAYSLRLKRI